MFRCCFLETSHPLFLEILASVIRQVTEIRDWISFKEKIECEVKTTDCKYSEIKPYVLKLKKKKWQLRNCSHQYDDSVSEVAESCPTLCGPMDCSQPGSSIRGISQARVLEWVVISCSRGSSWPRDQTPVSRIVGRRFYRLSNQWSLKRKWRLWMMSDSLRPHGL